MGRIMMLQTEAKLAGDEKYVPFSAVSELQGVSNVQQTPNPAAQEPATRPRLIRHSWRE
jgi:hypothetical protein